MLLMGVVTISIAVVIIAGARVSGGMHSGTIGWMSQQWVAEHRMAHS